MNKLSEEFTKVVKKYLDEGYSVDLTGFYFQASDDAHLVLFKEPKDCIRVSAYSFLNYGTGKIENRVKVFNESLIRTHKVINPLLSPGSLLYEISWQENIPDYKHIY